MRFCMNNKPIERFVTEKSPRKAKPVELPKDLHSTLPPKLDLSKIRQPYVISKDPSIQEAIDRAVISRSHRSLDEEYVRPSDGSHIVPLIDPLHLQTASGMYSVEAVRGFDVNMRLLDVFPSGASEPRVEILFCAARSGYITVNCQGMRYEDISKQINQSKSDPKYNHSFIIRVVRTIGKPCEYYHYRACSGNVVIAWAVSIEGISIGPSVNDGNVVVMKPENPLVLCEYKDTFEVISCKSSGLKVEVDPLLMGSPRGAPLVNTSMRTRPSSTISLSICSPLIAGWYEGCNAYFTKVTKKPVSPSEKPSLLSRVFFRKTSL